MIKKICIALLCLSQQTFSIPINNLPTEMLQKIFEYVLTSNTPSSDNIDLIKESWKKATWLKSICSKWQPVAEAAIDHYFQENNITQNDSFRASFSLLTAQEHMILKAQLAFENQDGPPRKKRKKSHND